VGGALGYVLGDQVAHWNQAAESWRWAFYIVVGPGLLLGTLSFFMRDVRSADGAATSFRENSVERHRRAEAAEDIDHRARPFRPRATESCQRRFEPISLREMKSEYMHLGLTVNRTELHTSHDDDAKRITRRSGLVVSGSRVVISQRHDREASRLCPPQQLGRRTAAIRRRRMCVQIRAAGRWLVAAPAVVA